MQNLRHIVDLLCRHARVDAEPESIAHDAVGRRKLADDAVAAFRFAQAVKARMLDEVARKEHARLYAVRFESTDDRLSFDALAAGQEEAEPARLTVRTRLGQDEFFFDAAKRRLEACKVLPALFDEGGQLLELCAADRRL